MVMDFFPKIDPLISASQLSSLGMCRRCGDLRMIACSRCNGLVLVKEGGRFNFITVNNLYQSYGGELELKSIACTKCETKGHFNCPACSKLTQD